MNSSERNYYKAIRSASRANLAKYYAQSTSRKVYRQASPKTRQRIIRENYMKKRYLALANSNRRAREMANRFAANRNIKNVKRSIEIYTQLYKQAQREKWSINNTRMYSFFPDSVKTMQRFVYHLKQHLKRLEFAKFLAGRKVAEMMLPKTKAHFYSLA
jgi:hypothetical protein